jgi:hypothetical protein
MNENVNNLKMCFTLLLETSGNSTTKSNKNLRVEYLAEYYSDDHKSRRTRWAGNVICMGQRTEMHTEF